MRYHYVFLDSVERDGDVELSSDTLHTQAELDEACREAYRIAERHNAANPETDEEGIPYGGADACPPDDSQVLQILKETVLPDLAYVPTSGYMSIPREERR